MEIPGDIEEHLHCGSCVYTYSWIYCITPQRGGELNPGEIQIKEEILAKQHPPPAETTETEKQYTFAGMSAGPELFKKVYLRQVGKKDKRDGIAIVMALQEAFKLLPKTEGEEPITEVEYLNSLHPESQSYDSKRREAFKTMCEKVIRARNEADLIILMVPYNTLCLSISKMGYQKTSSEVYCVNIY